MKILSILIPTTPDRIDQLTLLMDNLYTQIAATGRGNEIELCVNEDDGRLSIGAKRNQLLDLSVGKYIAFFDSDDLPGEPYINVLLDGINSGADCVSLRGIMTTNGERPEIFEHSIRYNEYKTTENFIKYERYPNHLNCIKSSIAKQFRFPDINHGEDTDFATQIYRSELLKNEYYSEEIIYHYQYVDK